MMMHYFGSNSGFGIFGFFLGMILHLAFAAIVVLGAIWLFKTVIRGKDGQVQDDALAVLKKRYAKGEITREEFQQMKKEIE